MERPKHSFRIPLPDGSNLSLAVFATRNDPTAEAISVQVTRLVDDTWVTDAKLAVTVHLKVTIVNSQTAKNNDNRDSNFLHQHK